MDMVSFLNIRIPTATFLPENNPDIDQKYDGAGDEVAPLHDGDARESEEPRRDDDPKPRDELRPISIHILILTSSGAPVNLIK
jgi:hypothetical protein